MMPGDILPITMVADKKDVIVVSIEGGWGFRKKLTDMGLKEGMKVKILQSHRPGPCVVLSGNTRLALGYGMAHKILVKEL
jgi:ferrous iron transport protein A